MKKKSTSKSAFFNLRILIASVFCVVGIFVAMLSMGAFSSAFAQRQGPKTKQDAPGTQTPDVVRMVGPVRLDRDLRDLPWVAPKAEHDEQPLYRHPRPKLPPETSSATAGLPHVQSLLQNIQQPMPTMPGPLLTFEGHNNTCGCVPPDSDGDVGPNHYVEAVNESIKIFDKTGATLSGPTSYNSFFSGLTGTPCANANDGDPFVLYDPIADRWLISDFAFPSFPGSSFWQCIGVSQTPNPVSGGWFLYAVQVDPTNPTFLGDYPKFAMWNAGGSPAQNAYFFTVNLFSSPTTFNGVRVFALDRASMLGGGPANAIAFGLSAADVGLSYSFLAANQRNGDPPPAGRNGMVLAINSSINAGDTETQMHARFFHVDFVTPANSTFGVGPTHQPNAEITVNGFKNAAGPGFNTNVIPQQGTTVKLDTVGDRLKTPVVYQNRGGTESLWATHENLLNWPNGPVAVRWYQLNVTGGVFPATPAQQQDWTNGNDGLFRWMPSIALDQNGNTVIGYSASGPSAFPSARYAGRLVADPSNDLGQGEGVMFAGTASQTSATRWGDYSMTTADPANNTDFWHVNEYATGGAAWHTRIGKFNFVGGGGSPTPTATASPSATPTSTPASCTWSAGPDMPTPLVRAVGVYFPANGNFYTMGGRTSDTAGSDFQHALEYSPTTNSWTQKASTFPDNQMNNMACGVLTVSGTPQIYCVGGSAAGQTTATGRVFSYNPVSDTPTILAGDDWPGAMGTILPGGFAVANNKLYILGGFNINVASINQIWEFDPNAPVGAKWTQKTNTPVGIMYAPTCTINGIIYVGGGSDYQGGTVVDTTTSFSFDPLANSIGTIATIPRATGETRGLNFNGKLYVIGGGRVAPNPSSEVNVYNPGTNTWTIDVPFGTARRNFPTDTDGTTHIWLSGGYASDGVTPLSSMEILCEGSGTPTPTPTATATATV